MARVRFLDQVPVGFYEVGNGGGGSGTPASPIGSIQFNNAGVFGGSSNLTWNNSTNTITLNGSMNATNFIGNLSGTASYATNVKVGGNNQSIQYNNNGVLDGDAALIYDNTNQIATIQGNLIIGNIQSSVISDQSGFAFAQGSNVNALGYNSYAQGQNIIANGEASHAEGGYTTTNGQYSHAEGYSTTANSDYSHAEGSGTSAYGTASHAEGYNTTANGNYSHAEGDTTRANGLYSHAEGGNTIASGSYSHAEGYYTTASGDKSHTEGESTIANGRSSHAEGIGTITSASYQHAQGMFNRTSSVQGAFILGNGTSDANRSNLIFAAGNTVQITGSLSVNGSITGSLQGTASFATTATQIQSGSIIASISPSSNVFTINSGSTNLVYVSASNGNMGVSGSINASALYAPSGSINSFTSDDINTSNINVSKLLSFDRMTSLKSFVTIAGNGGSADLIAYPSDQYYGVVIDGIAYDTLNDESLIFRCTVANTATKIGNPDVAMLSTTSSSSFGAVFTTNVNFNATNTTYQVRVVVTNTSPKNVNIRPMYRLVKQCITN